MVDLATLALELNTGGLARGEKDASAILSQLEARIDRFVKKANGLGEAINRATRTRVGGAASGSGGGRSRGGGASDDLAKEEAATIRLAQALARLQVAQGNATAATLTLRNALASVDQGTVTAIRAKTQLVAIEAQAANAAGKSETAILREAQALARLQQIAGNTPAAIKTLGDALDRVSNKNSLSALRAQLQKTYLDTNYANSPLIGAIRETGTSFQKLLPLLGPVGTGIQRVIGFASAVNSALTDTEKKSTNTVQSISDSVGALSQVTTAARQAVSAPLAPSASVTRATSAPAATTADDVNATQRRLQKAYEVSAAIVKNSKAEQAAAAVSRQIGQAEAERQSALRSAILGNQRIREKAVGEIAREERQQRALIATERERIAQAGKIETALQRQAAEAGKAAGAFGIFARAKAAALSFFRDQGGSATLDLGLGNLAQGAVVAGEKIKSVFSGIRESISGKLKGGLLPPDLFSGFADQLARLGQGAKVAGLALTAALTVPLVALAPAATRSAIEIDSQVNVLKAFTGSAEAAEARLAQLIATAQKTPGLTTGLAATLDAQLRVANVLPATIDKILPAIGRLNAISPLGNPTQFARNLTQLITQNFERADLKELAGQSPFAGELIKQVFAVDSPINSEAIRASAQKLGIRTADQFFTALAEAAASNPRLAAVSESLGSQIEKIQDRVSTSLRPLGKAILDSVLPLVDSVVPIIERVSQAFSSLPTGAQQGLVVFAAAIGPLVAALGLAVPAIAAFIQSWGVLQSTISASGALAALPALFSPVGLAIAGVVAVLGIAAVAWATYESAAEKAAKITASQIESTAKARDEYGLLSDRLATTSDAHGKLAEVTGKLPANAQAVTGALQAEGEKLAFVTGELVRQREVREATLASQRATITAGLIDQQKELEIIRAKKRELESAAITAAAAARVGDARVPIALRPTVGLEQKNVQTGTAPTLATLSEIGTALQEVTEQENKANKARDESAAKLKTLQNALGGNSQTLVEYAAKSGTAGKEVDSLRSGLSEYEQKLNQTKNASDIAASGMNALSSAAARAGQEIATAFASFNVAGLEKGVKDTIDRLSTQLVKEGRVTRERAAQLLKQEEKNLIQLPGQDQFAVGATTFGGANERLNQLRKANELFTKQLSPPARTGGGGSSRRVESAARQDRAAEEALEQARAKARFDIQEKLTKNIIELDKAAFEQRLISADDYYNRILRRELELQEIEKRRIQGEAAASARRLLATKDGSPEEIRELTQLVDLQARLRVIELDRPNILRKINGELEQTKKLEAERNREAIAQAALGGPGVRANARIIADTEARGQLKLDQPQRELRREEQQLQAAANAGLIREEQLSDAVTLARRRYRDAILESLEAKKRIALADNENAGRFAEVERINEEIDSVQLLGTELTRAERLRKRFAEQGVLDYSRVNDKVAELLAEQKGLTEIFQDFRAGQVQTAFGLIETGVDKLTEKLGVLGDAVGDFLKSLLKLAAASIFKKLFGLDSGAAAQSPGFALAGGAPAAAGGGGFNPFSLLTGGGQQGGGGGNFLTGGFSGGSPAQQILSGGGQGSPASSLLSKIPVIGKFFGASSPQFAAGGKIGANIGSLPGIGQFNIPGLGTPPISASGLPGAAAPGALAGLGATGLLAGGFLGGSLLGGSSPTGKLIGGAGGALALGALGGSGLLGGGLATALPALFSNPITAVIGGGLLATALAIRLLGGQDFKRFTKAVDSTYAVKIKGDKEGKSVFEQAKGIGEQAFGKGSFKNKIKETIALKDVKDVIAAYGEATGQDNSPLVKRATQVREIAEVGNSSNNFVRRATGGLVPMPFFNGGFLGLPDAGRDSVLTALRGQEYVTRPEITRRQGRGRFDALNSGNAAILSFDQRGADDLIRLLESGKIPLFSRGMRERLAAQIGGSDGPRAEIFTRASGGYVGPTLPSFDSGRYVPPVPASSAPAASGSGDQAGLRIVVAQLAETMEAFAARLSTIKPDDILRLASPSTVADAASQGFAQSTTATQNAQRALGVQQ